MEDPVDHVDPATTVEAGALRSPDYRLDLIFEHVAEASAMSYGKEILDFPLEYDVRDAMAARLPFSETAQFSSPAQVRMAETATSLKTASLSTIPEK